MANKKKDVFKPGPMTEGKRNIIQGLLQEYNIESAADIQEALKDLLGGTIKEMMEAEKRWMNTSAMRNLSARTMMITVTVTKANE